ncbi:MAG TPA: DegT/DnrJ/EryC1/StrS family aminotransferase [Candidatus Saccharimonadales bacterium]|nr:DegT/DnrJ/EryC1/StrS family aminotransferase [Candidatus Saccharimonadales bacterium]
MKYIAQMEPWIGKEEEKEILSVLKSGWITENKKTAELEDILGKFVGSRFCHMLPNGTATLFTALKVLGIGKGDEVIVPDFTMVACPNSIVLSGATPVFVDINKEDLCLDLDDVEKKITKKTKAIMPVALNGRTYDIKKLLKIAKRHKLFVIEDVAQGLGCYYNGKHLGTFGNIGSFSFSTPKVITTAQGGALVTNNRKLSDRIIRMKDFGRIDRSSQNHDEIGFNFKFNDILSAIGVAQMKKLHSRLKRKKEMYKLYKKELSGIKQISFIDTDLSQTSPWFIDIIIPDPLKLKSYLKTQGIGSREFYPAIHTTKPYRGSGKFPNSLWASKHGLWLPSSTFLTNSDIIGVCSVVKRFYEKN